MTAFFASPFFRDGLPTIPGSIEAIRCLREHYTLVIVTSRQHFLEEQVVKLQVEGIFQYRWSPQDLLKSPLTF